MQKQKVGIIWGVGAAMRQSLERDGIRTIADITRRDRKDLSERYGGMGERLYHLARGEDRRRISARAPVKSISRKRRLTRILQAKNYWTGICGA